MLSINNERPQRLLFQIAAVALALYGLLFIYIAVRQILYPGFLEPMEGDILYSIERAAHGQALTPPLSGETITLNYLPLYYFVCVPFYYLFGDSLAGPHLVSTLAALGSGMLVGWMTWREAKSTTFALIGAALYFSSYRIMDAYWTCGLPDSLLLFWLLLGFCFLAYGKERWHDLLALLFFTLGFWTKQQGALYFGFAAIYALFFRPQVPGRKHLSRTTFFVGLLLGGPVAYFLMGPVMGSKFFYYTLVVPSRWQHNVWFSFRRTGFVLFAFVPLASVLSLVYLRPAEYSWRGIRERLSSPANWFMLASLAVVMFTMTSAGSSNNQYNPFLAGLCVTAALGAQKLLTEELRNVCYLVGITLLLSSANTVLATRFFPNHDIPLYVPLVMLLVLVVCLLITNRFPNARGRTLVAAALIVGQLLVASYDPSVYLPEPGYEQGIADLRAELSALNGPVIWLPYGNVPAALTGKKLAHAPSWVSLDDIQRQQTSPAEIERDFAGLRDRVRNAKTLYVLSDSPLSETPGWQSFADEMVLLRDYRDRFSSVRAIATHWYSGRTFPRYLYERRRDPEATR
jgi:4-amino-4-deoxy-L-arabinose transferase-like glycosyltransferase